MAGTHMDDSDAFCSKIKVPECAVAGVFASRIQMIQDEVS